ncbi:hypothetical protein [Burkholderia ubonensis]|uniref:hypothetical protein n=1 Tax=Burkholderia ubonensis TaxID=101571 RepID=UPI000757C94B|nr:hypothetical protein [Burkholderia ubonensis]KVO11749.1 hypothetical protein WJ73_19575 [Burkholderia ubonensis]
MDWDQDFTIIGAELYAGDRLIGTFSSHKAAYLAIHVMRAGGNVFLSDEVGILTDADLALLEAINADEK